MARTNVLSVDPEAPSREALETAAAILRQGGLVAFPTETVYGLGANALDSRAVRRIFECKGRPSFNPLIVHVESAAAARELVREWPASAEVLAQHFWPGSLSMVLPRSSLIPDEVTGGGATVGLRCPSHPVALALLRQARVPIAAPSANPANQLSPTRGEHVLAGLGDRIDLLLEAGPTTGGIESTVLDLTGPVPCLLRPGLVSVSQIEAILGPVRRAASLDERRPSDPGTPEAAPPLPSPGMLARHYAPRTPMSCVSGSAEEEVRRLRRRGLRLAWIRLGATDSPPDLLDVLQWTLPNDPQGYAAALYDTLHQADAAGVARILVDSPPNNDSWLGVQDRLRRASTTLE